MTQRTEQLIVWTGRGVVTLLLIVVGGLSVDTFGELREGQHKLAADMGAVKTDVAVMREQIHGLYRNSWDVQREAWLKWRAGIEARVDDLERKR